MASHQIPAYTIESLLKKNAGSRDFDFMLLENLAMHIDHLKSPHRYHFYMFILVTTGSGSHAIDFHEYTLDPSRLFLIAPGQIHNWTRLSAGKGLVLLFNDNLMALSKGKKLMSTWPLFQGDQHSHFDLDDDEMKVWTETFLHIKSEIVNKDEFTRDAIFYAISSLLVRASRLARKKQPKRSGIGHYFLFSFQELIEIYFLTHKTPKEYAKKMNITSNYLNALCRKKSGKSAGELIRQRIVLEAKRLLAHTKLSISEIAFKLNFEDNSYFGRYFKKYTHLTPGEFRQQQQV
ncbi:MAG: AraC family transcriptional regulator [Cyclobacteriaceae bacterium]|nr:AraC family transcriptional regulator [Cyclobacteriaceae bacterium]MDH4296045.1 AraC family transcriptional regulator [Cyclobacteriaceae bacterium]MDH5249813.1 AraC family transcriptional regulator [Cyclobacteriaceae bacterium]